MSTGELTKAYLVNLETGEEIQCLFNPNEYSISKSNSSIFRHLRKGGQRSRLR